MNVVIATGYHQTVLLDKPRYPWYSRLWTGIPPAPQADTVAFTFNFNLTIRASALKHMETNYENEDYLIKE
jgi:hypothetical protein